VGRWFARGRDPDDAVADDRWLVVGLGNPGRQYANTRHNVGAEAVRTLADRLGLRLSSHRKLGGQAVDARPGGARATLMVPATYMNRSGDAVGRALSFYKLGLDRLIVCHDDLDLPVGVVRLKRGGGDGGHKGLGDIRRTVGANTLRVRIGIGRPHGPQDPGDYVLKPVARAERDDLDRALATAGDAVLDLIADGLEAAQNRHHAKGS
jgi:PTH1 family peptidyl-tRNA hydrolase